MKSTFKNSFILLALSILIIATTSCSEDDSAPQENEFFNINVDGVPIDLTYQNAIDLAGDNSIFVSGGLYPDDYSVTIVSDELTSTGTITCAENERGIYSVRLGIFSGPNNDLTTYDDDDDTCQSSITITRNNTYIEGTFTATLKETSFSNPETVNISGSFKVREDED
ncbi:hypothetical protein F0365_12235 [Nonlabens sp. Ci31]|uniref:hypothetical protein n=1 Tax=Nonlabens sp. Ci31 TaxID=2608253 RepID=UPI00146396D2|nr:hypothetical protein [Nonlabens sp. Ci31]QJP35102.1 hypothetical protein F0365_12235 [Nonlabens sp. Ci31]